jgi:protein-tyrosine sulfotransferase
MSSNVVHLFIGGRGRSGTTLVQGMLSNHPSVKAGPEFDLMPEISRLFLIAKQKVKSGRLAYFYDEKVLSQSLNRFTRTLLENKNNREYKVISEKSPVNVLHFDSIAEIFPNAKFINVIRDGRDNVCSHLEVGKRMLGKGLNPTKELTSILIASKLWTTAIKTGYKFQKKNSSSKKSVNCITIKYESLVNNPKNIANKICSFLDIPLEKKMYNAIAKDVGFAPDSIWYTENQASQKINNSRIGRWSIELSSFQKFLISLNAQETLEMLGYEKDLNWLGSKVLQNPFIRNIISRALKI